MTSSARRWSAASALYYAAIYWLSSAPRALPFGVLDVRFLDKVIHALVFGGLACCVVTALRLAWPELGAWRSFLLGLVVTACCGVGDELHQAYVPGRSSDFFDAVADSVGALAFAATRARRLS